MSFPAMNWCIEQRDLPPGEWIVLFHLCHCHNHETGRCDPSQDYLADMTGMGVRTVRRHLSGLEEKGRISRRRRGVDGGGRLSDYYILGHEPAKLAANVSGQSVRTNRPNGVENVHEMAGKHRSNMEGTRNTPLVPHEAEPIEAKKREPDVSAILCEIASPAAVTSFIAYRKKSKGKALTVTAAERLRTSLRAIFDGGGDPDDALGMAEERAWLTVKPEWYFRETQNGKPSGKTLSDDPYMRAARRRMAGGPG